MAYPSHFFFYQAIIHADSSLLPAKDRQIEQTDINTIQIVNRLPFIAVHVVIMWVTLQRDHPAYVRNLSQAGIDAFKNLYWLDAGLENRTYY